MWSLQGRFRGCSGKYQHVVTTDLVAPLFADGWRVDATICKKSGTPAHAGHALKLSRGETSGEYRPQIMIRNGSNGDTALQVSAGLYRFACANSIVAGASLINVRIAHRGADLHGRVLRAVEQVIVRLPSLTETVSRWASKTLTETQQTEFATRAAALRWDISDTLTVRIDDILTVRRHADIGSDLWTTFNRIQESVTGTGVRVNRRVYTEPSSWFQGPRFLTTTTAARPVTAVDRNLALNAALWNLAEEFSN